MTPIRTTALAPALSPQSEAAATRPASSPRAAGYGPPTSATRLGKRSASLEPAFLSSRMGRCTVPQGSRFGSRSGKDQADGSLRVVYAASIRHCRSCPLREQCQWEGNATAKPRQVSVLLHTLRVGPAPLLWRDWSRREHRRAMRINAQGLIIDNWRDWSRREHRRACIQLVRHQRIEVNLSPPAA